jgi:alkanesulfonate monooxygenase SsuD/methylene tetrahydromethanopterin reductase-like flavin-dependent oxidoreductase (luciferase family)
MVTIELGQHEELRRAVRLSLHLNDYASPDGPAGLGAGLGHIARAADEAGLDTLWISDQLIRGEPSGITDAYMVEAYTTLSFLAGQTKRIQLGTMVTGLTYRPPALLVEAVSTLDGLSGGRAWLGIGADFHQEQARALCAMLPAADQRFERLEETLRLALAMWAGDDSAFADARNHLASPVTHPTFVRRPHPPILIGETSYERTIVLAAGYADACSLYDLPASGAAMALRDKLDVLARLCEQAGRDPDDLEKSVTTPLRPGETAEEFAGRCSQFAALGIDHLVVILTGPRTWAAVEILAATTQQLARPADN